MDDDSQPTIQETESSSTPIVDKQQNLSEKLKIEKSADRNQKNKHSKGLITGLIVIVVILLCGLAWYLYKHHDKNYTTSLTSSSVMTSSKAPTDEYYSSPKVLNLNLITNTVPIFGVDQSCYDSSGNVISGCNTPEVPLNSITYNQVGLTSQDKPIIVASVAQQGLGTYYNYFIFIEASPSKYTFYENMYLKMYSAENKSSTFITEAKNTFSNQVTIDTTSTLSSLTFPTSVTLNNTTYTLPTNGSYTGVGTFINSLNQINQLSDPSAKPLPSSDIIKIGQVGYVAFYDVIAQDANYYQLHEIYGVIGTYAVEYQQYDTMTAGDGLVTFNQPNTNSISASQLMSAQTGCGNSFAYVTAKGIDSATLIQFGSGPSNQTVYELPDDSPFLNYVFNTDYQGGQDASNSAYQNLTIAQLQADGAVLVVKNDLNQYQVYFRNDIFPQAECGKPVIYLYPTQTESISVRVGATIYNSVPNYGINGWTDVIAQPNGQLTYDNNTYPSLYWEGTGNGIYPEITSGTIVKTSDAISTIKQQLDEQGLNSQEISDFINYWGPKLPNAPYIRLTWFNTQQMNQLAPLFITPKPQTLIRVFLDYQGLNAPYNLNKQSFITPERKGFTVVEWGGLLKNNL
jgi:hypothetical protein